MSNESTKKVLSHRKDLRFKLVLEGAAIGLLCSLVLVLNRIIVNYLFPLFKKLYAWAALSITNMIIVLVILGIIVAAYFVLWFIEYMKKHEEKKKLQNNTMELNKLVREVHNELKKEEEKVEKVPEVKEEKVVKIETEPIKVETPIKVEPTIVEEPKKIEEPIKEVVIGKDDVSPVEVKPTIIDVKEDNVVSNDSLKLNDKFEEKVEIVEPSVITPVDAPKNEEEVIKYKDEV